MKIQPVSFAVQDIFFSEVVKIHKQGSKAGINWVGPSVQEQEHSVNNSIALSLDIGTTDTYKNCVKRSKGLEFDTNKAFSL